MSLTNITTTLARIAGATKDSPIAVFVSDRPGCLQSVFANTIETQKRIRDRDPKLVGVFDQSDDVPRLRSRLHFHLNQESVIVEAA